MAKHPQVICITLSGEEIEVDVQIAPYVQRLWNKGVETCASCQWDGSPNKSYPAYINGTNGFFPVEQMAKILGFERWQWRKRNGVLWLHKDLVKGEP
jgi:hypothetical protein